MIKLLTHPEQVAESIRAEIFAGKWRETLPGIVALEKEFNVNRNTIQKALKILEGKKLLVSRGQGSRRQILAPTDDTPKALKVGMLLYKEIETIKFPWGTANEISSFAEGHDGEIYMCEYSKQGRILKLVPKR